MPVNKDKSAPVPGALDDCEVRGYTEHAALSEETVAFTAELWRRGRRIAHVTNRGDGGASSWYPSGGPEALRRFQADVGALLAHCGLNPATFIEPEEHWLFWFVHERPAGVSACDSFRAAAALFGG